MKCLYKIETATFAYKDGIKKEETIKAWKAFKEIRKKTAELIICYKAQKIIPPDYIKDPIITLKNSLNRNKFIEKHLVRYMNGEKYSSLINTDEGKDAFKNALNRIRESIRRQREYQRLDIDSDIHKFPGEILARSFKKTLEKYKVPMNSNRHIGIEIECIVPQGAEYLKALYPFREFVSVSGDGSIRPASKEEGIEVKIIGEREKIDNIIHGACKALTGIGARVNTSCGLHVHLDCRPDVVGDGEARKFFNNLYVCQSRLLEIVPPSRKSNTYCHRNRTKDFNRAQYQNRYRIINLTALRRHKTIEVRLFGGTLQPEKIINWYQLLVRIAESDPMKSAPRTWKSLGVKIGLKNEIVQWAETRKKTISADSPEGRETEQNENQPMREVQNV